MEEEQVFDVLVVGGGLAGLTAALDCQRKGLSVLVLEGRDRVGGRTFTVTEDWNGQPTRFDFGAHFIGDDTSQKNIWDLVKELGLKTFPQYEGPGDNGLKWDGQAANLLVKWNGGLPGKIEKSAYIGQIVPSSWEGYATMIALEALMLEMDLTGLKWFYDKAEYDAMSVRQWANPEKDRESLEAYKLLNMLCHVGFSADAKDISMLWFLFYIYASGGLNAFGNIRYPTQGAQGYRLVQGAMSISKALADNITWQAPGAIQFGKKVVALDFTSETGRVKCGDGSRYLFHRALVATSPQLADQIAVYPDLPPERRKAARAMRNGQTVMTVVHFKEPFWRSDTTTYTHGLFNDKKVDDISANGLSGNGLLIEAPIVWTMDNTSYEGAPAMFAFVVGKEAEGWAKKPDRDRRKTVLNCLGALYGTEKVNSNFVEPFEEKLWTTDPFSQGCPTGHFGPGDFPLWNRILLNAKEPFTYMGDRLFYASTESAMVSNGYMSGAVWAGREVASRIARVSLSS